MSERQAPAEEPSQDEGRTYEVAAVAGFGVCALGALGLAVVYWRGGNPALEGGLLALAFLGLSVGLVTWANHLMEAGPFSQEREPLSGSAEEQSAFAQAFEREEGPTALGRRRLLVRGLVAAAGALGLASLFPIASLGPRPGNALLRTAWRPGRRLITEDGRPVLASEVPVDGLVTVFPEGDAGSADGQAVLVRVQPGLIRAQPGREDWSPGGLVAYSKVCTHAGCPVGLYLAQTQQLLCPCHQSAFDVLDGAKPVFGPAAWPLPQLPLSIDNEGVVRAEGDFSEPVGPGYWRVE